MAVYDRCGVVAEESVSVWVEGSGGGLRVEELACGPSVRDALGSEELEHAVELDEAGATALAAALGVGARHAALATEAFFTGGGRRLSDLMDLLDRNGIGFRYEARGLPEG